MLDVAKRANVALSTVSYAINGTRPISEGTRKRINEAMEELNYRPNAMARGLASRHSRIIALLFPVSQLGLGITELEFVTSAAETARENGYNLILWPSEMHDTNELRKFTQQGLVDGVVVMDILQNDERINLLTEAKFPFSMIGRCADTTGINYVDIDYEKTVADAVDYLANFGHTHIALLNQSKTVFEAGYGPAIRTQTGFERAILEKHIHGISQFSQNDPKSGYDAFNALIKEDPDLSALISFNERAMSGVKRAVTNKGWLIPEDFSVVVIVSSLRIAELTSPPVTTADAPSREVGRLSVEQLIQQIINEDQETFQVLLRCQITERGSSGPNLRNSKILHRYWWRNTS